MIIAPTVAAGFTLATVIVHKRWANRKQVLDHDHALIQLLLAQNTKLAADNQDLRDQLNACWDAHRMTNERHLSQVIELQAEVSTLKHQISELQRQDAVKRQRNDDDDEVQDDS
ncbi:MAG: hypothetical protein KC983_06250 [Phycisphaerales bacterium]|nr:hypothetical protein [Phycisphaerales bacterium]